MEDVTYQDPEDGESIKDKSKNIQKEEEKLFALKQINTKVYLNKINKNKDDKEEKIQGENDNNKNKDSKDDSNIVKINIIDDDKQNNKQNLSSKKIKESDFQKDIKIDYNSEIKKRFVPKGLTKLTKFVYINPIMQLLAIIEEFNNYYIQNAMIYNAEIDKKQILSYVAYKLYVNFYENKKVKEKKIYNSENFLKILYNLNKFLGHAERTNINDVLIFVLNQLHDEDRDLIKKIKTIDNSRSKKFNHYELKEVITIGMDFLKNNNSIITDNLNYYLLKTLECQNCNNQYFDIKSFSTYELDICYAFQKKLSLNERTILTIKDCLDNEKAIKFYCDICKSYMKARRIYNKFYELNNKIIFLLGRDASFDENNYSIKIPFKIEEKINMIDYIIFPKSNCKYEYELICIISSEIKEKRFVCFSKSYINNKWYLYIDELIEERNNIEDVLDENNNKNTFVPYILMYSKVK